MPRVAALAGGVGAARLLRGIVQIVLPRDLSVIVNTADDEEFYGLHVSPDLDTTIYNLAGVAPRERGWGIAGDSRRTLSALQRFYPEGWFELGDLDLATHIYRTQALASGARLHQVTAHIARAFGIKSRVFPAMTLALLLLIVNFMLGGAAHTRALPASVHEVLGWSTFAVCCYALYREYQVLGDNNRLIEEAASKRQRA